MNIFVDSGKRLTLRYHNGSFTIRSIATDATDQGLYDLAEAISSIQTDVLMSTREVTTFMLT